ncbi:DUF1622 domain-containing protein [Falsiphaeobacter marinintestinus]|uniref:DUF1622 domain-containing protein n=1 Tax=Falsiphaeobacter marinintestinus TaxID=1492905 RepID=UPI0011B41471|nr:DUF1622 domain-containing protein [Phaeobacter marinintestinus]
MHGLETVVIELANLTQMLFEAASILVVAAGGIAFGYAVFSQRFSGQANKPRQALARFLIVALELQLAADIIATATNPSMEELLKLAAIAVIRTFLNYFLVLEMREESAKKPAASTALKG